VLPKRHLDNIIEMIYALDKVAPGMANNDTLLYGVEVKFYSSRLELSNLLETKLPGMFAIGDGAGVTRGLSQASASGVYVARTILSRWKKIDTQAADCTSCHLGHELNGDAKAAWVILPAIQPVCEACHSALGRD